MLTPITALFILALVVLICVLIWSFITFDSLLRIEYEHFTDNWESDGRPTGFFWHPSGVKVTIRSSWARGRCALLWPIRPPKWVSSSVGSLALISRLRILVLVWNIGYLIWFLGILILISTL